MPPTCKTLGVIDARELFGREVGGLERVPAVLAAEQKQLARNFGKIRSAQ
jgi:hypothetical protein